MKIPLKKEPAGHKDIRLLLTKEQRRGWRFPDGISYMVTETSDGLLLRPSEPLLTKIYLEPTSKCNLHCRTCVRNSWKESGGTMTMQTFKAFLKHAKSRLLQKPREIPGCQYSLSFEQPVPSSAADS